MIILDRVAKRVHSAIHSRYVLATVTAQIPPDRTIALLGTLEEDKRIFIDLIAGVTLPSSGRIQRNARVSFPMGRLGRLPADVSLRMNIAHIARLHNADVSQVISFMEKTLDIGDLFDRPYIQFPRHLREPLTQLITLALPFDVYLLGDHIMRGDVKYKNKSYALFLARAEKSGMIIHIRNRQFALDHCNMSIVLHRGQLLLFDNVTNGLEALDELRREKARR